MPLTSRFCIMRLLISTDVLAHNGVPAATCAITLWSNRLSWLLTQPAEPFFLSCEGKCLKLRLTVKIVRERSRTSQGKYY